MNEVTINNDLTVGNGAGRALLMNRYRILRQLGQGGMGSVWLAEDILLDDKLFAVKMLPSILVSNKRAYNQLKSEALVSMKLVHQNIVALRAFEENGNNPFLVMDYIEGETLDDWLEERGTANGRAGARADRSREPGAGEDEIIRLLRPVAEALDYAHREGVVHRDVKPSNVIIRKDGHPFILDFGIAREIQETMTRVTGRMSSGTLMYMSPEQLMDSHHIDGRADIYSLGVVLYEMLAGVRPNKGATAVELLAKAIKGEKLPDVRTMSPEVSAAVAYVLSLMCSPDPEKRPQTSIAAAKMLHKAATGKLVLPKKTPRHQDAVQNKEKAARKRRAVLFSVLAGLASLFAAGVAGIW